MKTLAELRASIDSLDQQIIDLLAQRAHVVEQIGELKTTDEEVVATDRQRQVFATRRAWATERGLDPELVERLYRQMIDYFIEKEREQLQARGKGQS